MNAHQVEINLVVELKRKYFTWLKVDRWLKVSEAQTRMANVSAATNLREVARAQNVFVRLEK